MAEPMDLSDAGISVEVLVFSANYGPFAHEDAEAYLGRLLRAVRDAATARERERCALELEAWAQDRWKTEVQNRPSENIHRRTLDETWKQVERDGPTAIRRGDGR